MAKHKKQQPIMSQRTRRRVELVVLVALIVLFFSHAERFIFIQDDAFITFRYIQNFVEGNGLVFNIGERVEGYTTFLWTILLALPAKLGFDLITASQYIGVLFGLTTLYILYFLSNSLSRPTPPIGFSLISVLMFTASSAAAYWSISGMETGLFMFLTVLGVWLYLRERNQPKHFGYTPIVFVLLSLTRPEGMLLFALTMAHYAYDVFMTKEGRSAERFKKLLFWIGIYSFPTAVFMIWRYLYYGYLFPNTFYAKAGISPEYFSAGLDYFANFAKNYLLWGVLLLLPIYVLMKRKWASEILYLCFVTAAYTTYVIVIGGDVLPAFRFFIPVLPLIYLLVQEGLYEIYQVLRAKDWKIRKIIYAIPFILAYFIYQIPYDYVQRYWQLEQGLVDKMTAYGLWLKARSTPNTVIAASTIGALSYYSEVTLIDMLGLTDETIAHHPEQIFGIKSGWRERNYNVTYVLSRKPDWICFSTGFKPSAFAERALFTRKEFRQWYYPYYFHPSGDANEIGIMYKRADTPLVDSDSSDQYVNNEFINNYYDGVNRMTRWPKDALEYFKKSQAQAPPDFALLYEGIAGAYLAQKNHGEALRYYERALAIDPRMFESRLTLAKYAFEMKDYETARRHYEALVHYQRDYTGGWIGLGQVYRSMGDNVRAQQAFERAYQLTPRVFQ